MRAVDLLAAYSFNSLRTIARTRGYAFDRLRRAELLDALGGLLFDPREIARAVDAAGLREREILRVMVSLGGRATAAELMAAVARHGIEAATATRPRESLDRISPDTVRFDELCAQLTARGLLFSDSDERGPLAQPLNLNPGATLIVPGPILAALAGADSPSSPSASLPARPAPSEPEIVRGRLIVQPSFTLLLLPPFDEVTVSRLDAVADRVRSEETLEWRLAEERWKAAVHANKAGPALVEWLAERAGAPLPQNVSYTLQEWSRQACQVVLWQNAAVITGPAEMLDRLAALPDVAALALDRPAPDRLVLSSGPAAQRALAAAGENVLERRYDRPARRAQIHVSADGVIEIARQGKQAAGNLLVPIVLARFCEPSGDGRYRLDRDRWQRAVANMPDGVTGLLQWLRVQAQSLPPALVTRLKLWADPAPIRLDQPLLLRLRPEHLSVLRADPEIAPLLGDDYAPDDALVVVDDAAVIGLRALFAARGIELSLDADTRKASI